MGSCSGLSENSLTAVVQSHPLLLLPSRSQQWSWQQRFRVMPYGFVVGASFHSLLHGHHKVN